MYFELIVILLCLVINALLAAIEMAFVAVSNAPLRELNRQGDNRAKKLLELKSKPERVLSIVQVGITLVGALAAAIGGAGAQEVISPFILAHFNVGAETAESIAILIVVIPTTALSVLFGELLPKAFALKNPLKLALRFTGLLVFLEIVLRPLVSFLEMLTHFFLKRFSPQKSHSNDSTELELESPKYLVSFGITRKISVKEIMVPAENMACLQSSMTIEELQKKVIESGHTRLPVYENGSLKGIINSKELHLFLNSNQSDWLTLVRGALYLEEHTDIQLALRVMQGRRSHMGFVVMQGEVIGLVTLEDILEEFIGDIYDEDDDNKVKKIIASRRQNRI